MYRVNHLVPEQMFSTATDKAQGISAVKALAIAGQQGQKIWTIDKNNLDLALSKINLGTDAEIDIRNAVNAGKIATAHESRINFNGWIGEGYILMDPKTGAGAYMISGGGSGGELIDTSTSKARTILGFVAMGILAVVAVSALLATIGYLIAIYGAVAVSGWALTGYGLWGLYTTFSTVFGDCDLMEGIPLFFGHISLPVIQSLARINLFVDALWVAGAKVAEPDSWCP